MNAGIYLLEFLNLVEPAKDGAYEGILTVAPLKVTGATGSPLINTDMESSVVAMADALTSDECVERMNAITRATATLRTNAAPLLAFEALFVELCHTSRASRS